MINILLIIYNQNFISGIDLDGNNALLLALCLIHIRHMDLQMKCIPKRKYWAYRLNGVEIAIGEEVRSTIIIYL